MEWGYIRPSKLPYGFPILFVDKKDKTLCMHIDYHTLNKITIKNNYPLPWIYNLFDRLNGASYFTHIHLKSRFILNLCCKHKCGKNDHEDKICDAPSSSLMDSTTSLKVTTMEGEGVGARSLACSTSRVEGCVATLGWGLGWLTSGLIFHMDLHKPNNKLA
jgi:hypothetical protein